MRRTGHRVAPARTREDRQLSRIHGGSAHRVLADESIRELLGDAPLPLRPGGDLDEDAETALAAAGEVLPDFDAMAQAALADDEDDGLSPGEIDPDYADLDGVWEAPS